MDKGQGRWKKRALVAVLVIGVSIAVCLCGCLVFAALDDNGLRIGPSGLGAQVCIGAATAPRLQVGVAWYSPLSSHRGPLAASPYAVCVDVPWLKTRSLTGEWVLPP
ncbi:MAG: hypothetical protein GVY30_02305 [Chloroflexi bacterium]|nr:hypothetical protein [Chloroflexota bacterium]